MRIPELGRRLWIFFLLRLILMWTCEMLIYRWMRATIFLSALFVAFFVGPLSRAQVEYIFFITNSRLPTAKYNKTRVYRLLVESRSMSSLTLHQHDYQESCLQESEDGAVIRFVSNFWHRLPRHIIEPSSLSLIAQSRQSKFDHSVNVIPTRELHAFQLSNNTRI